MLFHVAVALLQQSGRALRGDYLLVFRGIKGEFRKPEWAALSNGRALSVSEEDSPCFAVAKGYKRAEIQNVGERSTLIRYVMEIWGEGSNVESCAKDTVVPMDFVDDWRLCVLRLGASRGKTSGAKLRNCRDPTIFEAFFSTFSEMASKTRVDLQDGTEVLVALNYFKGDHHSKPSLVYCGRVIARGDRDFRQKYALNERKVLGSTTMDIENAALMARLARIDMGHRVLDPFAGSCGCLLATTRLSKTSGIAADINDELVNRAADLNFKDLPKPTVIAPCDIHDLNDRLEKDLTFDAIVTDPPYGRRETCDFPWLTTLLQLATSRLKPHTGRLVFFVPHATRPTKDNVLEELTTNPLFSQFFHLEATPTQHLSACSYWYRTLIVLRRNEHTASSSDNESYSHDDQERHQPVAKHDGAHTSLARAWRLNKNRDAPAKKAQ